MNFASDDFFSPIRHVTSDSDTSVDFENSSNLPTSNMAVTSSKSLQKESVVEHNKIKCDKETDKLRPCSSESTFVLKPETPKIPPSKRSSNSSKRGSKTQLDNKATSKNEKFLKNNVTNKEIAPNSSGQSKQQGCEQSKSKDAADYDPAKLNCKQVKKSGSRPTSLSLSIKEGSKGDAIKKFKKERNVAEFSKNSNDLNMLISNAKHSEKKLIDTQKGANKSSEISNEKSTDSNSYKSLICNSSNSKSDASGRKSSIVLTVQNSDSTSNMPVEVAPFEMSVEKIVHDLISSECEKIRQNMYAQQMSIYRELNKVKEEMKRQHSADTEHLLQIMKNLMQLNISLKSVSQHKA